MLPNLKIRVFARPQAVSIFAVLLVSICFTRPANAAPADDAGPPATPVLVELFTSEGCSTCPPADALVQRMDDSQPLPGARLIVLSEHVDYWDHDGWKDPYSSHSLTERQISYVRALRLAEPSTPQIIVDGKKVLLGDSGQIQKTLADAAVAPKLSVRIASVAVDPAALRAHVDVNGAADTHRADIFAVLALNHAESQVLRGENGGRRLSHVAVVEEMKRIGEVSKGHDFSQDVQISLKPGTDPKNLRLIVFVQESGPGKVLGAAMQRLEQ